MDPRDVVFVGGSCRSAIGNVHRIASQMDGRFRLVGGCFSRSTDVNTETALQWGVPTSRLYDDLFELIDSEKGKSDTAVVLTPVFSHAPIILALLEAGFNVISEKPLVAEVDDANRLVTALTKTCSRLLVTFNYTGYPMVRELKRRIGRGDFGVIKQVRLTMQQESYVKKDINGNAIPPQKWRLEDRSIPTVSLDLGMHVVHLQQFLVPQRPLRVISRMASLGNFQAVIDDVDVLYECENGLLVHGWWSKAAAGYANGLSVEVFGTDGSARWVQSQPESLQLRGTNGSEYIAHRGTVNCLVAGEIRYNRFKAGHPDGFIEAFANLYSDFAECLGAQDSSSDGCSWVKDFSVDQSRELLRLLAAASYSARSRTEVGLSR